MEHYRVLQRAAIGAGAALLLTSAAVNVSHLVDSGHALLSPMVAAVVVLASAAAVAARVTVAAARDGRTALAVCTLVALGCGELFGLVSGAERLLAAREERARVSAQHNAPRELATQRVATAEAALAAAQTRALAEAQRVASAEATHAAAERAALAEAQRGGCGRACKDLRSAADRSREHLEAARAELKAINAASDRARELLEAAHAELRHAPAPRSLHLLADVLGWSPARLELVPALLFTIGLNALGFTLLAFGHDTGRRTAPAMLAAGAPQAPGDVTPPPGDVRKPTRADQVAAFIAGFQERHGRAPSFTEVREALQLPAATASKYRARALACGVVAA